MKYYTINEEAAARAKEMYSWFDYKHGTKTAATAKLTRHTQAAFIKR